MLRHALDGVRPAQLLALLGLDVTPLVGDDTDAEAPDLFEIVVPFLQLGVVRLVLAIRLDLRNKKKRKM